MIHRIILTIHIHHSLLFQSAGGGTEPRAWPSRQLAGLQMNLLVLFESNVLADVFIQARLVPYPMKRLDV